MQNKLSNHAPLGSGITIENLLNPQYEGLIIIKVNRIKINNDKDQALLWIAEYNILLAVKCLLADFSDYTDNLRVLLKENARLQARKATQSLELKNAFLALNELEDHEGICYAFQTIGDPKPVHKIVLQHLICTPNLKIACEWLQYLFSVVKTVIEQRQSVKFEELPSHQLWLWGLESFDDSYNELLNEEREFFFEIYDFFAQQSSYSTTLNILHEKFPEHETTFEEILLHYNDKTWLRAVYDRVIQHQPEHLEKYYAKAQAYNILDQISYSTLINKAKTFEQAFGIFEEMKSKGLIPNVITFNTLLKKAKETGIPLRVILDILEEMLERKIMPQVESSKPYTLREISAKLKKSRQPFKAWAMHQETKLAQLPPHIRNAWQMLFDAFN